MRDQARPEHTAIAAGHKIQPSILIRAIFGVMSGVSNVGQLSRTLSTKAPEFVLMRDQKTQDEGGRLSFKTYDGIEELSIAITHSRASDTLRISVKAPSGLKDRIEIADSIVSTLKHSTDGQINFNAFKQSIVGDNPQTVNNAPINVTAKFDIPQDLEKILANKAQATGEGQFKAQETLGDVTHHIVQAVKQQPTEP